MTRFIVAIACLVLAACFHAHPDGQRELRGQDCYSCHTPDYEATAAPVHRAMPEVFSTTCGNCHRMTSWQPALEGAHSEAFAIAQGDHAQIPCQSCHDLASGKPSALGANTNCLGCHPDEPTLTASHTGVTLFAGSPYTYQPKVPNFCLECHPGGTAEQHPDQAFARKADHAVVCSACHDRTVGPDDKGHNVTCVESRCHHTLRATDGTDGHKDGDYQKARSTTDRAFCHKCHE